jgi:uncharacterized protein (DUF169 family)
MDNHSLADGLSASLKLQRPPVGLAFVESRPEGVGGVTAAAPSACTFWRRGEEGVFYAGADDHNECPIGVMTMGFQPNERVQAAAMETLGMFVDLDYFSMDEVAHLPSVKKPHSGVVYGPLGDLPVSPDVVLVVVSPYQAMLLSEAGGSMALKEAPALSVMGRPACAAIPRAISANEITVSLGCIGARTYAEVPEDQALVAIPVDLLEPVVSKMTAMLNANSALAQHHAAKKAQFELAAS